MKKSLIKGKPTDRAAADEIFRSMISAAPRRTSTRPGTLRGVPWWCWNPM